MKSSKVLHVGNILNNGYLNCKFLRRSKFDADSITIDYRHVQAQPEWEEVAISEPSLDHSNPDWQKIDLKGYHRPDWFFDIEMKNVDALTAQLSHHEEPEIHKASTTSSQSNSSSTFASIQSTATKPKLSQRALSAAKKLLRPLAKKLHLLKPYQEVKKEREMSISNQDIKRKNLNGYYLTLIDQFKQFYPDAKPLTMTDIEEQYPRSIAQKNLFDLYPLIQAYSLDPIYVMLACPGKPFIAFEHGTMRDFPYEDSSRGRLYALALQKAEKVIITNADCNLSAERLGLTNYVHIPHPVDEAVYYPNEGTLRKQLQEAHNADWIFVAPARHHWSNCPKGMEGSWFKKNDYIIRAVARLKNEQPEISFLLVFFEWGQEVELSKSLIKEVGIEENVLWQPISSKPIIKTFYDASHIVLDQFNNGIGTFGTVVPEAMASGKPVIINYKESLHRWCFKEPPPLHNCTTSDEIFETLKKLIYSKELYKKSCTDSRNWFLENHSSLEIVKKHLEIYAEIEKRHNFDWDLPCVE